MYDVFLSFRGEDTRHGFTAFLYEALVRSGIHTFRDDDAIPRGEDLKPEIEKAIKISKGSIIVLSINYANSRWCLDELWLILEQKRKCNHFVLPIFYHVNPSHVRNHKQSFAIKPKKGDKWTQVNVNRWKKALKDVANLTGMVLSVSESQPDFIAKIVDIIDDKLDLKLVSIPAHLTGMDTRADGIKSWLKDEQSSAEVFAICGMRGSGKTTLAKYIYNSNKHLFESSSFLEEIGNYKQSNGLLGLQKQLLTDILGGRNIMISNESEGTRKIEHALELKRVLIVLDDIDEVKELEVLLGTKTLHTQSKIIITTTFLNIDTWFGSIAWKCWVQELELLDDDESVELLSWYAFGSKIPLEGFEELSEDLADYCEGNPLALKVLGSSLYVNSENHWKRHEDIEIWRSTLNSLSSLNGDLYCKIQGVIRKSYDSLPRASHKELFLHIAIFFLGKDKDYVVEILEPDWYAKSAIRILLDRCLLTVSTNNKLMMHQLLQDMGRTIVLEESKDPAKRSRVWHDESYRMLRKGYGSKTIEGLTLDMRMIEHGMNNKPLALKTASLAEMDKLKLLQLKYVELTGSYTNFPELRWLCWHGCRLKTLPFGLLTSTLVAIDMVRGYMEKFDPSMVLGSLKILKLRSCYRLVSICNLHRLLNLETLILSHCSSLTYVCKTIGDLKSLSLLNLKGCSKLWKDSLNTKYAKALRIGGGKPKKPMFSLTNSLKRVILSDCDLELNNDVRVVFHAQSFFHLSLCRNLFELLPKDIDLKMLRVLDLACCQNLKSLPCLPSTLEVLYTDWCTSLEKITFESVRFTLKKFEYKCCFKLSEIQGLFKLVPITKLDEADLGHMIWIKSYEDRKVDLVGDEITKGRTWHLQVIFLLNAHKDISKLPAN